MTAWMERGVCRDEDPELFFPIGTTGLARLQADEAKTVCLDCPVRTECLDFALKTKAEGIYGGTDEDERRRMRRRTSRRNAAFAAGRTPLERGRASQTSAAAEKRQRYSDLRADGYTVQEAAWELCITHRHAQRYEADLTGSSRE